ncbi:MAG: hypothetical protein HOV81_13150 [Kofleriaceae bacterium]|nr:hypothetical protein [Kofleriaceae bacterium]
MRWLLLAVFLFGCSSPESCPAHAGGNCSTLGLECSYPGEQDDRDMVCTCDGERFSCSTCGDLSSCNPAGDHCSFSDWERDCDCGCTPHGHWSCTGFYPNYGCPSDGTYQDAGVDGMR